MSTIQSFMEKGFIFDFDGTIGETIPMVLEAFNLSLTECGLEKLTEKQLKNFFGPCEKGVLMSINKEKSDLLFSTYLKHYKNLHPKYSPHEFEGIKEVFEYIKSKGCKIGIITGKSYESAILSFEQYGIDLRIFDDIMTGSPKGGVKPECMRAMLSKWLISPNKCYYVGDSVQDIMDCAEVGMNCIAVSWSGLADKKKQLEAKPYKHFETVEVFSSWIRNLV